MKFDQCLCGSSWLISVTFVAFFVTTEARAETFAFRVAFEDVPGVEDVVSGNLQDGIVRLETELDNDSSDTGFVLATLCGAYIMDMALDHASRTCDAAVKHQPGRTAFNNRGVLRALLGDFEGAREDFEKARPAELSAYLEDLRRRDVGLVANDNFRKFENLTAGRESGDKGISIEQSRDPVFESIVD